MIQTLPVATLIALATTTADRYHGLCVLERSWEQNIRDGRRIEIYQDGEDCLAPCAMSDDRRALGDLPVLAVTLTPQNAGGSMHALVRALLASAIRVHTYAWGSDGRSGPRAEIQIDPAGERGSARVAWGKTPEKATDALLDILLGVTHAFGTVGRMAHDEFAPAMPKGTQVVILRDAPDRVYDYEVAYIDAETGLAATSVVSVVDLDELA